MSLINTSGRTRRRRTTKPIDKEIAIDYIDNIGTLAELTWDKIALLTGYNERSLRRIDDIYSAFWSRKDALSGATANRRDTKKGEEDETVAYLKRIIASKDSTIAERDEIINLTRQVFVQLVVEAQKEGFDVSKIWNASVERVLVNRSGARAVKN